MTSCQQLLEKIYAVASVHRRGATDEEMVMNHNCSRHNGRAARVTGSVKILSYFYLPNLHETQVSPFEYEYSLRV
jgi:hypothetical protein